MLGETRDTLALTCLHCGGLGFCAGMPPFSASPSSPTSAMSLQAAPRRPESATERQPLLFPELCRTGCFLRRKQPKSLWGLALDGRAGKIPGSRRGWGGHASRCRHTSLQLAVQGGPHRPGPPKARASRTPASPEASCSEAPDAHVPGGLPVLAGALSAPGLGWFQVPPRGAEVGLVRS